MSIRIIPRLDIKGSNVVKGIHMEGLRIVGKPAELAKMYFDQGADEIVYIDIVASLYERNSLLDIIEEATSLGVFIPITVGGGIRSTEDIKKILRAGADKISINTTAVKRPEFITEASNRFGAQCIVGAIDAKKKNDGSWEVYIDNGRERTNLDAIEWAKKMADLGVGEILITSIDNEGTEKGYDTDLVKRVVSEVDVPVIAGGGAGKVSDIKKCLKETKCSAISLASILHYQKTTIGEIKNTLSKQGCTDLRLVSPRVRPIILQKSPKNSEKISIVDYGLAV